MRSRVPAEAATVSGSGYINQFYFGNNVFAFDTAWVTSECIFQILYRIKLIKYNFWSLFIGNFAYPKKNTGIKIAFVVLNFNFYQVQLGKVRLLPTHPVTFSCKYLPLIYRKNNKNIFIGDFYFSHGSMIYFGMNRLPVLSVIMIKYNLFNWIYFWKALLCVQEVVTQCIL